MGGGAAMRAAAKVAGIGVVNGGIRGGLSSSVTSPAEQSVKNAKRPVSKIISSSNTNNKSVEIEGFQKPAWEISDEWEFAGFHEDEEDLIGPATRVVFGPPPSLDEAKAATADVKDALEKVCLSSNGQMTGLSSLFKSSDSIDIKSCVGCDDARAISAPSTHAMKVFTLLNQSPQAQTIVASIATDPNVWDAVFKNEALQEYLISHKTNAEFQDLGSPRASSVSSVVDDNTYQVEKPTDIFHNIKHAVGEMVNNVSAFVQKIFGLSGPAENADANAWPSFLDKTLGASFMALAVMVIMVVVLKRG